MEWISVKDRLPKYGQPVLLVICGVVQHITYELDGAEECKDWFAPLYDEELQYSLFYDKASHWMPLPDPPEKATAPKGGTKVAGEGRG